ncbi:hypothetical protein [Lentzea sp. NPDC004782]|uniref:hypothetical protein n=1 Tax=Lentzea sp. NPDC004782 TaxID=3154458 RepID=UPI0033BEFE24
MGLRASSWCRSTCGNRSTQVEVPFQLSQLPLTVGDVDGDGRREAAMGAEKAAFTVR